MKFIIIVTDNNRSYYYIKYSKYYRNCEKSINFFSVYFISFKIKVQDILQQSKKDTFY